MKQFPYKSVAKEAGRLLGIRHKTLINIRFRIGECEVREENLIKFRFSEVIALKKRDDT